jgi:hypothetical protein
MQVGNTALAHEVPGALELDLVRTEVLEETAPIAEEDRG